MSSFDGIIRFKKSSYPLGVLEYISEFLGILNTHTLSYDIFVWLSTSVSMYVSKTFHIFMKCLFIFDLSNMFNDVRFIREKLSIPSVSGSIVIDVILAVSLSVTGSIDTVIFPPTLFTLG